MKLLKDHKSWYKKSEIDAGIENNALNSRDGASKIGEIGVEIESNWSHYKSRDAGTSLINLYTKRVEHMLELKTTNCMAEVKLLKYHPFLSEKNTVDTEIKDN